MMVQKATSTTYQKFCKDHQAILPVFYQPWYLDACCQGQWESLIYTNKEGEAEAIWPYYIKSKYFLKYVTMPMLVPYMGPWIKPAAHITKHTSLYSRNKKILSQLSDQLPSTTFKVIHTNPMMSDLLPLQWKGFNEQKRYTYQVDLTDSQMLWSDIDSKQRNIIRAAQSHLTIYDSDDVRLFYELNQKSFYRQNLSIPYSQEYLLRLDNALKDHQQRVILFAKDDSNNHHGAIYVIHDDHTAYLLAIGSDSQFRNQGSIPLLIWTAMERFQDRLQYFDFEGSMIPSIESFFRSFGGRLTPYSRLSYVKNTLWETILKISGRYG